MSAGERRVELERASQGDDRLVLQVGHAQEAAFQGVGSAERGPRRRVTRIELHRPLEQRDRAVDRIAPGRSQIQHATRVGLECLDRCRLVPLDRVGLRLSQLHIQGSAEVEDDAVLELEDVADAPVDLEGAQQRAVQHLHELRGDAYALPDPLIRARHDPPRAQSSTDFNRQAV